MNDFLDSFLGGLEKIAVEGGMTLPVNPVKSRYRSPVRRVLDAANAGYNKLPQDWKNAVGVGAVYGDHQFKKHVPAAIRAKLKSAIEAKLNKHAADKGDETVYAPSRKRDIVEDNLKHLGYSLAGTLAGGVLAHGLNPRRKYVLRGTNVGVSRGGALVGGAIGQAVSQLRARKRMKRRLQEQGLDDASVKKLQDRGLFEPRLMDAIPLYGRLNAAKDIRQGLQDMGKRSRGHGTGLFTDPYKSA